MGKTPIDEKTPRIDGETDRRAFLRLASLGTVMGGAALVAGTSADAAESLKTGGGYQETVHVRTYYNSARF